MFVCYKKANASDDPDAAEEECFPPALRYAVDENGELTDERTEPIGGDLRPGGDGWTSVFLKAVAGIMGLGYDAFARRERKRRRWRQMVAAALALIALIGGFWTWDYYRVKTDYYANVATVWGVPTGVGELDAELRQGMSRSLSALEAGVLGTSFRAVCPPETFHQSSVPLSFTVRLADFMDGGLRRVCRGAESMAHRQTETCARNYAP